MLRNKKNIFRVLAISFILFVGLAFFRLASAQIDIGVNEIGNNISLSQEDPRTTVARVINVAMSILGLLALVLVIWGGFVWMTANGEEDKIDKAKKIIRNGVIGLVIILSAWGIVTFILSKLLGATNGTGTGTGCTSGQTLSCGCGGGMSCIDGSWGPCLGSDCNTGGGPDGCDSNSLLGGCQAANQICDESSVCNDSTCLCEPKGELGDACDGDVSTPTCDADNNLCGEYLTCGPSSCVCEGQPVITMVTPVGGFCKEDVNVACDSEDDCAQGCDVIVPNGAGGNLMTINGTNFGAYDPTNSKVLFAGDLPGDSPSTVNPECIDSWTNKQIIIAIPQGSVSGSLKVVAADSQSDTTDNEIGPELPDFIANNIDRPGLCLLTPESGRLSDNVSYRGINLYNGSAYFGNAARNVRGLDSVFVNPAGLKGTATVPYLQKGGMSSFVVGTVNSVAQRSNYVTFIKDEEPDAGPYISYFGPVTGRAGQYVTISGGGFGGARGNSKVYFGDTEADYTFPKACSASTWRDKQVIVKVPAELPDGNYEIKIDLSGTVVTSQNSNPNTFTVNANESLKSSICKISPAKGPIGTPVSLWGEYFGDENENGLSVFSRNRSVSGVISTDQGAQRLDPNVPDQAVSGPVRVEKNSQWGNEVNFEVGNCSADAECSGEVCCPTGTYKQGRCAPSTIDCYIDVPRSVFEWGFATGFGNDGDEPEPYDSCDGMAKALGACQLGAFCPNSPGLCSPFSATSTSLGNCDSSCVGVTGCQTGCSFNSGLDACVLNNGTCSLNTNLEYTLGGEEFTAVQSCKIFPQFGNQAHWQISTPASCPNGWVRLDGNRCIDSASATVSSCDVCSGGFACKKNGNATDGVCASAELCQGTPKCEGNKCVSTEKARCDCCCEIGQDARDCCAGLTCAGACGTDTNNDPNKTTGYGECTGCTVETNGVVDTEASDRTCNCDKFSGKYCDTSTDFGNCGDCSRLSTEDCLAHSSTCCLDSKGTAETSDDVCSGGSGEVITDVPGQTGFGYCAGYDCQSDTTTPPGDPSLCATSTPTMYGTFKSISSCTRECEADPGVNACSKLDGNLAACGAKSNCCYNLSDNKCISGNDKTDDGHCAYYNCKASPEDDVCDIGQKLASGTYSSITDCVAGCPFDPEPTKPGLDCRNLTTTSTDICNASFCGSPYACLNNEGGSWLPGGDCGSCCCEVGNPSSCSGLGLATLTCQPNQAPCSGENRGLCCGCSADTDCGDAANVGCDSGTCCRARPSVIASEVIPAHGASAVCRNATIQIPFDQSMDPQSLMNNLILLEENDYANGSCPTGTFVAAADGFKPVATNWFSRAMFRISRLGTKLMRLTGLRSDSALADVPDPTKLYCSVPGTVTVSADGNGSIARFAPKRVLSADAEHFLIVKGDTGLDSNSGVLSQWQLGMNGQGYLDLSANSYIEGSEITFNNLTFANSFISSFVTLPAQGSNAGVCIIDYVQTKPESYLFQSTENDNNENDSDPLAATFDSKEDRDKVFVAEAFSADGQSLHPTSGYYWTWDWSVAKPSIASIQTVTGLTADHALIAATSGVTDDSTMLNAKVNMDNFSAPACNSSSSCVCAEPDCINNCCNAYQTGDGLNKETPLFIFLCENPWPAVNQATQSWSPWFDTCAGAIGNCQPYYYKFYYCRDAGQPGFSDDLPAMINPAVIRGTGSALICSEGRSACTNVGSACGRDNNFDGVGDGFCIWDVLKESYFFKETGPQAGVLTAAVNEEDGQTVRLEWQSSSALIYNANPAQAGKYRIYYAPVGAGNMAFVDVKPTDSYGVGPVGSTVCSPATPTVGQNYTCHFRLAGLETNKSYRFKVSAVSAAQVESVLSDEKTATVTDTIPPATPQGFTGVVVSPQRLRFTWQVNTTDTVFYRVYHGVASGQYGESYDSENGAVAMEIDSQQFDPGNHYFAITAVDASGNESTKSIPPVVIDLPAENE